MEPILLVVREGVPSRWKLGSEEVKLEARIQEGTLKQEDYSRISQGPGKRRSPKTMNRRLELGINPGRLEGGRGWVVWSRGNDRNLKSQGSTLAYTFSALHQGELGERMPYSWPWWSTSLFVSKLVRPIRCSQAHQVELAKTQPAKLFPENGRRFRACKALATRCGFQEMSADSYSRRV